MQLNFVDNVKQPMNLGTTIGGLTKKKLQTKIDQILKILSRKKIRNKNKINADEITVVFLSSHQMRKINFQFRKKNKPTDVLSFSSQSEGSFGELLLCPAVLKKQAREYGHSFEVEITTMIIHGILHLLGYDHEQSRAEEKLMFNLQNQVLELLTAPSK